MGKDRAVGLDSERSKVLEGVFLQGLKPIRFIPPEADPELPLCALLLAPCPPAPLPSGQSPPCLPSSRTSRVRCSGARCTPPPAAPATREPREEPTAAGLHLSQTTDLPPVFIIGCELLLKLPLLVSLNIILIKPGHSEE